MASEARLVFAFGEAVGKDAGKCQPFGVRLERLAPELLGP